jgi:nucleolar protein TMA23
MAIAKRDAAKRGLYSRFFRGPVLGPETLAEEEKRLTALVADAFAEKGENVESVKVTEHIEVQTIDERVVVDLEVSKSSHKKRKTRDTEDLHVVKVRDDDDEEARRERKRQRKEEKRVKKEEKEREIKRLNKEEKKRKGMAKETGMTVDQKVNVEGSNSSTKRQKQKKQADESEDEEMNYKWRKEEKKRAKALRKLEREEAKATVEDSEPKPPKNHPEKDSPSKHLSKWTVAASTPQAAEDFTDEVKKKKKKRKQSGNSEESN